jgi:hypothetical protein
MVRNGRAFLEEQSGVWFKASNDTVVSGEAGPGTISSIWAGPDSSYNIIIRYFDEDDGRGWYGFYVNEDKIDEWFLSANNNSLNNHAIENVPLKGGDELRIAFYTEGGELNRTDVMTVTKVGENPQGIDRIRTSTYPPNRELQVSIYSITGSLLKSFTATTDGKGILPDLRFNEQNLSPGLYIYSIHGKNIPQSGGKVFIHNNW